MFCLPIIVSNIYVMRTTFPLYQRIVINEITYEMGDQVVTARCEIFSGSDSVQTTMLISHTDLNRIIARISAMGYEFKTEKINAMVFDDGTEIMEYKFDNVFGERIPLENFEFINKVCEIRA